MKLLIVAMCLTVAQTTPPTPRQASNNSAHAAESTKEQTKTNKTPAPESQSPINTETPKKDENSGNAVSAEDTHKTVRISEWPPVSIPKGWTDYSYWVFSFCLVIVGGLQIWLLYKQLKTVDRQADIAELQKNQMIQAGEQTERIINQMKETEVRDLRAYIGVSKVILKFRKPEVPEIPRGIVEIQNFGKTPACKVRQWIGIGIGPHPLTYVLPESSNPKIASVSTVFPNIKNISLVDLKKPLPVDAKVGTPELTVYVYGRITYEDVFKNEWYTSYRFIFGGPDGGQFYRDEKGVVFGTMGPDSEGNDAT
jgi:hypothetical protein